MKELTREELPTDGTRFVVTWICSGLNWSMVGRIMSSAIQVYLDEYDSFVQMQESGCTNIRFWQFPEGETK